MNRLPPKDRRSLCRSVRRARYERRLRGAHVETTRLTLDELELRKSELPPYDA